MNELERTKAALGFLLDKIDRSINERMAVPDRVLVGLAQQARDILNPPPAYEEVEITRWECKTCGTIYKSQSVDKACCWGSDALIPLTGLRKVEKPQQRERSVSVEAEIAPDGFTRNWRLLFRHYPECHGKQVTLTATWPE